MVPLISGIVLGPDDKPLSEARIHFTESPVPLPEIAALTSEQGEFSLSVPSFGTYRIECNADGFTKWSKRIKVSGVKAVSLTVHLKKDAS